MPSRPDARCTKAGSVAQVPADSRLDIPVPDSHSSVAWGATHTVQIQMAGLAVEPALLQVALVLPVSVPLVADYRPRNTVGRWVRQSKGP